MLTSTIFFALTMRDLQSNTTMPALTIQTVLVIILRPRSRPLSMLTIDGRCRGTWIFDHGDHGWRGRGIDCARRTRNGHNRRWPTGSDRFVRYRRLMRSFGEEISEDPIDPFTERWQFEFELRRKRRRRRSSSSRCCRSFRSHQQFFARLSLRLIIFFIADRFQFVTFVEIQFFKDLILICWCIDQNCWIVVSHRDGFRSHFQKRIIRQGKEIIVIGCLSRWLFVHGQRDGGRWSDLLFTDDIHPWIQCHLRIFHREESRWFARGR